MLRHREFDYIGESVPELNEQTHGAFLIQVQKAVIYSLEQRKLLTNAQRKQCLIELEKQYKQAIKDGIEESDLKTAAHLHV